MLPTTASSRTTARRLPAAGLAALVAAVVTACGGQGPEPPAPASPSHSTSPSHSAPAARAPSSAAAPSRGLRRDHRGALREAGRGLGEADGVVPDGTTVFDEVPAVTRLDPDLLTALRRAATDAKYGLCQIYENEAWHYELRPGAIDDGCPAMYADPTHDPRMQP